MGMTIGGREWRKWCGDEGPWKSFYKSQRALRQEKREKRIDREMKDHGD